MARCPFAAQYPVRNHSGPLAANLGLILHVQEGNGSLRSFFDNPSVNASSTFWVSRSGNIEQYVDSGLRAWAQGAGNATYNSVETEGWEHDPLTDPQIRALAQLYRWGHEVHGWPYQTAEAPGQSGFGWHGMGGAAWGGHLGCPGNLRKAQRGQILALAQGAQTTSSQEDDDLTPEQAARLERVESLLNLIIGSVARQEEMTKRVFVDSEYEHLLDRTADAAGRRDWIAKLTPKDVFHPAALSPQQMDDIILGSSEYKSKHH